MRTNITFPIVNHEEFKKKLLLWCSHFRVYCFLDSNNHNSSITGKLLYTDADVLAAAGSIQIVCANAGNAFCRLKDIQHATGDWLFGILGYDLKNELEKLNSENYDGLNFHDLQFFQPEFVFVLKDMNLTIHFIEQNHTAKTVSKIFDEINRITCSSVVSEPISSICNRISMNKYTGIVQELKKHIHRGDIFEVTYCQEFYQAELEINAVNVFLSLIHQSPSPFSCIYRFEDKYLISSSPERFLKKAGSEIISQPMKGTIKRSEEAGEDKLLAERMLSDPKEFSENIMIVDLVRNDLSRTALNGSVQIAELCGIYSYKTVHQMVSTVTARLDPGFCGIDALKHAFPMGSMTGAPKVEAMKLIEKYEDTKRGVFSGAAGYFKPDTDFDFNVVIRSILYNKTNRYLSYMTGSAITAGSDPFREYEECMLKAMPLEKALGMK